MQAVSDKISNAVSGMSQPAAGALLGAGTGAAAGLLTELFSKDVSLREVFRNMMVGGGAGAALGAGIGAVAKAPKAPAAPETTPAATRMDPNAAGTSMLPIVGPAYQGYVAGGLPQAAMVGGRSALEGVTGAAAATVLSKILKKPLSPGIAGLFPLIGMSHGAYAAAQNFNEKADAMNKAASGLPDAIKNFELPKDVSKLTVNPYAESGGAAIGGLGGAALGGVGGLAKTLFDSEDDGIVSALKKALKGAVIGGGLGAAAGAGTSYLARQRLLDSIPLAPKTAPRTPQEAKDATNTTQRRRETVNEILKRFSVPVGPAVDRLRNNIDQEAFQKEVLNTNARESIMSMLAPLIVAKAQRAF